MIKGFTMKLYEGQEVEYEKRHNLLWPEMKEMIHRYGGKNLHNFLDPNSLILLVILRLRMKSFGVRAQKQR